MYIYLEIFLAFITFIVQDFFPWLISFFFSSLILTVRITSYLLFVCLFGVYRWRATYLHLYSALMAIEQWWFFIVPYMLWHGSTLYILVISEDPGHSHPCVIVLQWIYQYLFWRLWSVLPWSPTCEANAITS